MLGVLTLWLMSTECYAISFDIEVVINVMDVMNCWFLVIWYVKNRKYFAEISFSDNDPLLLTKKCISCMIYFLVCSSNKCVFLPEPVIDHTKALYTQDVAS